MSLQSALRPVSGFARFVATALTITSAARMVIVALSADGGSSAPPTRGSSAPVTDGSASPQASGEAVPPGKPVRMRISVDVKPDRADVYIDGVQKGRVPFVGDVSCLNGGPFVVEVRPKSGPIQRFERTCKPGTTRIE